MGAKKLTDEHSIAVIGLSCRFPGNGDNPENFWRSICAGESAWSKIPKDRFNIDAFWSPFKGRNTIKTPGAHFLKDDIATFDAGFFNLPKIEVEAIDPQHRIMIEVAYEALERAGLPIERLAGTKTGVFMGHFTSDYKEMLYRDPDSAPMYSATGSCTTSLSGRISWLWDLRGPCFTLDTACSSSLVALHQACMSLRTGESDIAIVGGTSLLLNPEMFMYLSNQDFLSPDGKSKAFAESANGYGRGEGFGCVVLRRVDDAIRLRDPIRAVIRGTGSNHDGHTKGLTLPSATAQADLIREVYRDAGLGFEDTTYVEAHGTGTQAGDLAEMQALGETIGSSQAVGNKLTVGSVKTNIPPFGEANPVQIGHLEAAAGIAGVIKSILMLEAGLVPPNLYFDKPNPKIRFEDWRVQVSKELAAWPTTGVRRISVNSFGYAGTNAHAILDDAASYLDSRGVVGFSEMRLTHGNGDSQAPSTKGHKKQVSSTSGIPSRPRMYIFSSQDKDGLKRVKESLATHVDLHASEVERGFKIQQSYLERLAFTLSEHRSHLKWRTYAFASSADDLVRELRAQEPQAVALQASDRPRLGFIFTGQGAQWPRMGMELMAFPVFREAVCASEEYLQDVCSCSWSTVEELNRSKSTSQLHLAEYSQTLCAVLQVALIDLLRSWGIEPVAVAGHSSGEIAAAYALGALTREDAWRVAYYRGVLSAGIRTIAPEIDGSMMAVGLSPENAQSWISQITDGDVVLACINSPTSVTVSGDTAGIDQLFALLKQNGIFARKLLVDTAYHSPHMHTIAQEYYEWIADLEPTDGRTECIMHSSVTGNEIAPHQLGVVNWVRNLTSPVRFAEAVHDMLRPLRGDQRAKDNAVDILVEIGPHSALQGPVMQTLTAHNIMNIPYQSAVVRNQNAVETILSLAGSLWARGCHVDFQAVNRMSPEKVIRPLTDLPAYPWRHTQRYYHEVRVEREYLHKAKPKLSLIGAPISSNRPREFTWRRMIRLVEEPWIADHKIQGSILYPGAGYLAMAMEAASQIADQTKKVVSYKLRDIQLSAAAIISEDQDLECVIQLRPHIVATRDSGSTWTEFAVTTSPDAKSIITNCSGLLLIEYQESVESESMSERTFEFEALKARHRETQARCTSPIDCKKMYADMALAGLEYGPAFANVVEGSHFEGHSCGTVQIPDLPSRTLEGSDRPHVIHPGTLDAVFHLAFASTLSSTSIVAMVPKFISEVTVSAEIPYQAGTRLPGCSVTQKHGLRDLMADIIVLGGEDGKIGVDVQGLQLTEIVGGPAASSAQEGVRSITSQWVWKPAVQFLDSQDLDMVLGGENAMQSLTAYLELLHHSNPSLSILEVAQDSTHQFACQSATAIETAEITIAVADAAVKARVNEHLPHASVVDTDLSRDDLESILDEEAYDVVMAQNLKLRGRELEVMISKMIVMLKPAARICLVGDEHLASWFRTVHKSQFEDLTTVRRQDEVLIIATKRNSVSTRHIVPHSELQQVRLVSPTKPSKLVTEVIGKITVALQDHGFEIAVVGVDKIDAADWSALPCISLMELDDPLLEDLTADSFKAVKKIILESSQLLWVTGLDLPSSRIVDGLARVVRNENPGLRFSTFHVAATEIASSDLADLLSAVFKSSSDEDEFVVRDGLLHIGRIREDHVVNRQINSLLPGGTRTITTMPLRDATYPIKLTVRSPGMLDTICMEHDAAAETDLEPSDVEIRVKVSSINFRDLMTAMGQIPDSTIGVDAAGIIARAGSAVTKFKVGDRVAFFAQGAHSTNPRTCADNCALIPDNMSFEEAASVPTIHGTAWYALIKLARVQPGQSLLVHAAAGGVGQAAIQIAKHIGMEIFATVSNATKRQLLCDTYGIPDDHIFNSRDVSFAKGIKRMTKGRGVDVVLNSLSGEALRQTWHCIAPFGYFVEIGLRDILNNTGLDMAPFKQDATFTFLNLAHVQKSRPDLMAAIVEGTFEFIRQGISKPVKPITAYPISEVERAFRLMQAGKHLGKLVLTWGADDVVPVLDRQQSTLRLDPDAAYMLVGGLGGLGRSLSDHLVDLGARKLCFVSRSGAQSPAARSLVLSLEERGVRAQVLKCDISSESALSSAVSTVESQLGPIRGVVQGAMVLRDTLFANMTHRQWVEATRPKIQGTWNLHQQLPEVDFFVTLSSAVATFGNRGQSNYSAAGAYQDALAYHRRALGLRATTVDLGIMRDVGVLAETGMTDNLRDWEEPYGIREPEFHALIENAVDGDMKRSSPTQIITGLATGGSAVNAGIDMPYYLDSAKFSVMALSGMRNAKGTGASGSGAASGPTHSLIAQSETLEDANAAVVDALARQVSRMLSLPLDEIDTSRFLHNYGIDSLLAIEVVNWALKDAKSTVNVFDVLSSTPMTSLAAKIAAKSSALRVELVQKS